MDATVLPFRSSLKLGSREPCFPVAKALLYDRVEEQKNSHRRSPVNLTRGRRRRHRPIR
jgi:hypothetical protein